MSEPGPRLFLAALMILAPALACAATQMPEPASDPTAAPPLLDAEVHVEQAPSPDLVAAASFDHTYAAWDGVLRRHVSRAGLVDYPAVKEDPAFGEFLDAISGVTAETVSGWSHDAKVAFYSNAYNALTFQTILDVLPVASIRDIQPDPWENSRWTVAGRTMSLNEIEHKKLRGDLKEPRVHFILVCAAKSCPVLPSRAILPEGLDGQLDRAARAFFVDTTRNRVDATSKKVYLSRIMEWYGGDFVGIAGARPLDGLDSLSENEAAVLRYMARFVTDADRAVLGGGGLTVVYNEYDWALNSQ